VGFEDDDDLVDLGGGLGEEIGGEERGEGHG
jgi:hypothetical protein